MANSLYQALLDKVRRVTKPRAPSIPGRTSTMGLPDSRSTSSPSSPEPAPGTSVVPFAPGRIYRAVYTNYKTDPRPLIFILSSNAFYTHAINIHYLGVMQRTMMRMIISMRESGKVLTGAIMYEFLKARAPAIPQLAYRMYFTKYLRGKLVSNGVSQTSIPGKARFVADPFVRQLENLLRPKVINKVRMTNTEAQRLADEMEGAQTRADIRMTRR